MKRPRSLRSRLLFLIVTPLLVVAIAATWGRYETAKKTSQELYDNTLLVVATTVSRDVTLTQGDLLAEDLIKLLTKSLGDQFFYHVTGPGLPFVTGYTNPPRPSVSPENGDDPFFYDATYRDQPVRVVRLFEYWNEEEFSGWVTITVWQTVRQREALSLQIAQRAAMLLGGLIIVVGLVVWFGVNLGLRPLLNLREAVTLRSSRDLRPIARPVPREVKDLVGALNGLFGRLAAAFAARDVFVSNAAHQLRNPIAGMLAQAQAVESATDESERMSRTAGVIEAARRAGRLTSQLLSMERLRADEAAIKDGHVDMAEVAEEIARELAPTALRNGVDITFDVTGDPRPIIGDQLLLSEALENLIDNAMKYGCKDGGNLAIGVDFSADSVTAYVADDGPGVPPAEKAAIFDRFQRGSDTVADGSGLGLSIVREIAKRHGGDARLTPSETGARFELTLPYTELRN